MTWPSRLFAAGIMAMLFGVVGCARSTVGSWGVTSGATSQRDDGVMYSYSALHLARNGQIYTLLATARGTGNTYRGGEGTFHGELHAKDGVKIGWSCTTKDGRNGKVIIDDQEFDLAAGALFLVSTSDTSAHVQQLTINSTELQTCSDVKRLLAVMKATPDMASYIEHCKVGE